jgi:nitrogen fixation/metabolism regulation signal transduction histidine kinase
MFDESTRTILQEVERLRVIVDEFSRFARLPAPKLRNTDLREIIAQTASLRAKGEATLKTVLPKGPLMAFVDADQITQVLHNLLQNAQDAATAAHPDGSGAVRLSLEQSAGTLYIQVEDNGAGIAADQTEAIFEPYYTRKESGTGLGLAITQRIVTEHGGRIDVESKPGRTVFTVVLPRV